jgi:cyclophilin family peptidyl-prolyl cis-trans isomerase
MNHIRFFLFFLCCLFALCLLLPAQESEQYVQSAKEAEELGPKNKAFMDSFKEFQDINKTLTAMKIEYQDAKPERQSEMDPEYRKLYKRGRDVHKQSIALALDAHDETPNRNPWVIELLYSTVGWEFNRENYEEAVRIFKRLAASGISDNIARSYISAGLSAMMSMRYEEAQEWLTTAGKSGEFGKLMTEWSQGTKAERGLVQTIQGQLSAMAPTNEAWTKEQEIRKAETEAGEKDPAKKLPRVEITTTKGKIVLELFENEAPNTVANFISLIEAKFYNGVVFHRVLPNFMAQGGDPTGTGTGGPGYSFDDECGNRFPQARKHFRGSISMANAGPNTNGSQFFLTFVPTSFLDGRHTVFGRVVEGLEVLADIQRLDPSDENAKIPELDKIVEAKVLNKRNHAYQVKKNGNR